MSDAPEPTDPTDPENEGWIASASNFLTTRIELVRLEAREAGKHAAKRLGLVIFIIGAALFSWLIGMAGLIGLIAASKPEWPWYWVTISVAALHLLAAVLALLALKKPAPPSFPVTRAELSKDQAWLESLKNDPKSRN
ncbi:MAG: phage holin family protein [Verrucomicrobiota bacterium]